MYAKLVFPAGTQPNRVCRDIARTIANSNGAGGSTVGALEFVTAGQSTIEDTVAANWTLAAGQSIPTGADVEQDKRFYFQQTHQNSSTKTITIQTAAVDTTGFTEANNTTYGGVTMGVSCDYGQSYQWDFGVPVDNTSAINSRRFNQVTGEEVHIIARNQILFIAGYNKTALTAPLWTYFGVAEPEDTYEMREGRNRPGQTYFWSTKSSDNAASVPSPTNDSYYGQYTNTNNVFNVRNYSMGRCFIDQLYDYWEIPTAEVRVFYQNNDGIASTPGTNGETYPAFVSELHIAMWHRDTGEADGNSATYHGDWSTRANNVMLGKCGDRSIVGNQFSDPIFQGTDPWIHAAFRKDLNGNPCIYLHPWVQNIGTQSHHYDYATTCGIYFLCDNFSSIEGDVIKIINDGTDDYVAVKQGYNNLYNNAAIAVRK